MGTKRIGLSPNANHKTSQLNTYEYTFKTVEKSVVFQDNPLSLTRDAMNSGQRYCSISTTGRVRELRKIANK